MNAASTPRLLALDLGATKFAYRLHGGTSEPVSIAVALPRLGVAAEEFAAIEHTLAEQARRHSATPVLCAAPCVSADGIVESWPNRPYWRGFPLLAALRAVLGTTPEIIGDGEAAAVADAGTRPGQVYLSLFFGTGVAGGVVQDGQVLRLGPLCSDLGHIVTDPGGERCRCGQRGCFQTRWAAFSGSNLPHDTFEESLARITAILAHVFPRCVISLGGRFFSEDRDAAAAVLAAAAAVGRYEWSPTLRLSRTGLDGPLIGALIVAGRIASRQTSLRRRQAPPPARP